MTAVKSFQMSRLTIVWGMFIVVSAAFMRQVLDFFLLYFSRGAMENLIWGAFAAAGFIAAAFSVRRGSVLSTALVVLISAMAASYASTLAVAEERIHLVNFGILGFLSARDISGRVYAAVAAAVGSALVVSVVDETFQYFLPYRIGDLRDVWFGCLGGLTGGLMFAVYNLPCQRSHKQI